MESYGIEFSKLFKEEVEALERNRIREALERSGRSKRAAAKLLGLSRTGLYTKLAKYGMEYSEDEDTETLRDRLANFYAQRTLTKKPIMPKDQAEAIFLLVSGRLAKTTGQIIAVDGGLADAFFR